MTIIPAHADHVGFRIPYVLYEDLAMQLLEKIIIIIYRNNFFVCVSSTTRVVLVLNGKQE